MRTGRLKLRKMRESQPGDTGYSERGGARQVGRAAPRWRPRWGKGFPVSPHSGPAPGPAPSPPARLPSAVSFSLSCRNVLGAGLHA